MRRRGFEFAVLARETARNFWSAPVPSLVAVAIGVACGLAVPLMTAIEVGSIVREDLAAVAAGTNTMSITGENRGPISAGRCDQLNAVSGVLAAGGIASREHATVASRPNESLQLIRGTAGLARILWPGDQLNHLESTAFIAGSSSGTTFGIADGTLLALLTETDPNSTQPVLVGQVAAPSTRSPTLDSSLFEAVPPVGAVTECLVESVPGARAKVEAVLVGWFPVGSGTSVSPYFQLSDPGPTAEQRINDRITKHLPLAAIAIALITMIGLWYSRKSEFALYRSLGLRNLQFLALLVLETFALVLLPVILGISVSLYLSPERIGSLGLQLAMLDSLRVISFIPLIPLVAYVALIRSINLDALKGR